MNEIKRIANRVCRRYLKAHHSINVFAFIVTGLLTTAISSAQVVIRGTESSDNSAVHSEVAIQTMDRTVVPLVKNVQQINSDATERTESVTKARLNDGTYFDWRRASTVERQVAPDVTQVSTVVNEMDRQGGDRVIRDTTETVEKTDAGEKSEAKVYTRNSSGHLLLDRIIDATTLTNADGQANTTRNEMVTDVNGDAIIQQQKAETTVGEGTNEKITTGLTRSVDHLTGLLGVTDETSTTVRSDGGIKQIDTEVRTLGPTGWEVAKKTSTTETTTPDGFVTRETIEQGRPLYATCTGDQVTEPLEPQRKIVEQQTRNPDGTFTVRREVFHRDVNGEWTRQSFSTDQPDIGIVRPAPPPPTSPQEGQDGVIVDRQSTRRVSTAFP